MAELFSLLLLCEEVAQHFLSANVSTLECIPTAVPEKKTPQGLLINDIICFRRIHVKNELCLLRKSGWMALLKS